MKNRFVLIALAAFSLVGSASADIQSPPGHHYNWSRKLSRGLGNMVFSPMEYATRWRYTNAESGPLAAISDAAIEGSKRSVVRLVTGAYEILTFPFPSWKLTYRPPFYRKEYVDNWWGYTEFSPDLGGGAHVDYSRSVSW